MRSDGKTRESVVSLSADWREQLSVPKEGYLLDGYLVR